MLCDCCHYNTKTYLYNFDPFKPHFYIVKLGFTGVYIIFLISAQNIDCGYSLEPPPRGGSNECPQSTFLSRNMTNIRIFYLKIFHFLMIKFSVYLNRHVFVITTKYKWLLRPFTWLTTTAADDALIIIIIYFFFFYFYFLRKKKTWHSMAFSPYFL